MNTSRLKSTHNASCADRSSLKKHVTCSSVLWLSWFGAASFVQIHTLLLQSPFSFNSVDIFFQPLHAGLTSSMVPSQSASKYPCTPWARGIQTKWIINLIFYSSGFPSYPSSHVLLWRWSFFFFSFVPIHPILLFHSAQFMLIICVNCLLFKCLHITLQ